MEKEYNLSVKTLEDQIEDHYSSPALLPVGCILLNHFRHRVVSKPLFPAALTTAVVCLHPRENSAKPLTMWNFFLPDRARCELWRMFCVFDVELSRGVSVDRHPADPGLVECTTVRVSMRACGKWPRNGPPARPAEGNLYVQNLPFVLLVIQRHRLPDGCVVHRGFE